MTLEKHLILYNISGLVNEVRLPKAYAWNCGIVSLDFKA